MQGAATGCERKASCAGTDRGLLVLRLAERVPQQEHWSWWLGWLLHEGRSLTGQ